MSTNELQEQTEVWSTGKKFFSLFLISYLFFYMFPFPISELPYLGDVFSFYASFLDQFHIWVGKNLLQMPDVKRIEFTGSGDTSIDFVKLLSLPILSFVAALLTLLIYKKQNYATLYRFIIVYTRYYVGLYMLLYGFAKVFEGQFPFPRLDILDETYGNSSPMGLLWRFMGFSKAYTIFAGIGELIAGILLLFRRTTVLGCMITIGVMLNVAMLNFSYDVPVKLFSSHLVIFSIIILAPNIHKLIQLFFFQKTVSFVYPAMALQKKWMRIVRFIFKAVLIIGFPTTIVLSQFTRMDDYNKTNALEAIYTVDSFTLNRQLIPPEIIDSVRWKKMLIVDDYVQLKSTADTIRYLKTIIDTVNKKLTFQSFRDSTKRYDFVYEKKPDNTFLLNGVYKNDTLQIVFKTKSRKDMPLVNRGFHWIQEYAFNY